jgi:hypothetical protein
MGTVNFTEAYARLSDEKLRDLAKQYKDLMPDAQAALTAELRRRGLNDAEESVRAEQARPRVNDAEYPYFTVFHSDTEAGCFEVRVPRGSLYFPEICPVCGKAADTTLSIGTGQARGRQIQMLSFKVPHCTECKSRLSSGAAQMAVVIIGVTIVIGVVLYALVQSLQLTLGLIMMGMLLAFNSMRSLARKLPTGIFVIDFDAESLYLGIRSGPYADQFCLLNKVRGIFTDGPA